VWRESGENKDAGRRCDFFTAIGDMAAPYCLFTACRCRAHCGVIKKRSSAITESAASSILKGWGGYAAVVIVRSFLRLAGRWRSSAAVCGARSAVGSTTASSL
jgi:hypothetical protein